MKLDPTAIPTTQVNWPGAVRIIRGRYPPIDLFEDIADPADWPLLISAEMKTNPRLMETLGQLDRVPPARRVAGPGASYLMSPFTHISTDRPSRFSDGSFGVLYAAQQFETAVFETVHHHGRFMAATHEAPGWTSQFREIVLDIGASLHQLTDNPKRYAALRDPERYAPAQLLGSALHAAGSNGVVYPSVRHAGGTCAGLFWPDLACNPRQGRDLAYHWNGNTVDIVRDAGNAKVWRIQA
ncbi:MAG: RES family NAD+ phosphorylase [Burkholderiaceae bacterium]